MFNAKSVDPDQMAHSAASDLGLHCLPMSLLWKARLNVAVTTEQLFFFFEWIVVGAMYMA